MTELTQTERESASTALDRGRTRGVDARWHRRRAGRTGVDARRTCLRRAVPRGEPPSRVKWDAYGAEWERLHREQRGRYLSPHDQAVLKAAQEWEARQRQMYPISQ